ncbi:hypothetical protein Back11_37930 [Paenibacillus baekrokdamisoli]|uniref:ATP-grasp domain-containing protein n=1 Tax=Paenibacillus baekrokdamisoli TaxID=1712516 RepID=A0A3G9JEK4_9BACL|nr:ATP-grasp domain-containing protein [Paenibacillus baekrokdamisoli]MBB3068513.1 peptidase E [Paenibacillus baekrokdamisoli]BBH22448.1 hypothetical protein Back11_37930 [Paenibacillus baekrokdamisoli]
MIKDYAKSRKHEWEEACFIPDASNSQHVQYVVRNLIKWQGAELSGDVVFREYVELEPMTKHPKSGMPQHRGILLYRSLQDQMAK